MTKPLADLAAEAIWRIDGHGSLREWNAAYARLHLEVTGLQPVVGAPCVGPPGLPNHQFLRERNAAQLHQAVRRFGYTSDDGTDSWELVVAPTEVGKPTSGLDVVARVVERDDGYDARRDFIARISHEIRSPLGVIVGMSELAQTASTQRRNHYLERIHRNARVLLHLISDILDFSKIEAGQMELNRAAFDPVAVIQDVVEATRPAADTKGLQIKVVISPAVPQAVLGDSARVHQVVTNLVDNAVKYTNHGTVEVRLDVHGSAPVERLVLGVRDTGIGIPEELHDQVYSRFFRARDNAHLDATGTGLGLTITRSLVEHMGGRIELESTPGEGSLFRVLLPCERASLVNLEGRYMVVVSPDWSISQPPLAPLCAAGADVGIARDYKAALPTLARVADRLDLLLVDDRLGEAEVGLLVEVVRWTENLSALPILLVGKQSATWRADVSRHLEQFPSVKQVARLLPEKRSSGLQDVQRSLHILMVDDSADNRALITHMLSYAGHRVTIAHDGLSGVERFREHRFDMVLLDLHMPGVDGFEAAISMRDWEQTQGLPPTPIVALTAHATEAVRKRCLAVGMDDFASKPITQDGLFKVIAKSVRVRPRVLLAGWEDTDASAVPATCESAGVTVFRLESGQDVEALFTNEQFDMLVVREDQEGPEYATALNQARTRGIPVVRVGSVDGGLGSQRLAENETLPARLFGLLRSHFGTTEDPGVPSELIDSFIQHRLGDIRQLSDAVRTRKAHVIRTIGHRIKGTAASYGFPELTELGDELESAGQIQDFKRTAKLVERLQAVVQVAADARGLAAARGR